MAEISGPLTAQFGALLEGRLERAHSAYCSISGALRGAQTLRYYWHLQGRRYGRLGQEDAGIEERLSCDELCREGCVCYRAGLLLLEKPARP